MILNFKNFLNEELRELKTEYNIRDENGNIADVIKIEGNDSNVYSASKYDVLKKSKFGYYNENEIQCYELMKKRNDLFCSVFKIESNRILIEKLDTKRFNKDFEKYSLDIEWCEQNNPLFFDIIIGRVIDNSIYNKYQKSKIKDFQSLNFLRKNEIIYNDDFNKNFLIRFMDLKMDIYQFFEKSNLLNQYGMELDLHPFNFAYKKGTNLIKCFDPITYIYEKN